MRKSIRDEILKILYNPSTVTDVKRKLPQIRSFGTIAYHLKELEREGVITKYKEKKKQGQPTTYQIQSKNILERIKTMNKVILRDKIAVLNTIKNNPSISDSVLIDTLEKEGYDSDSMNDSSMDVVAENLAIICYKITPKGEKFLKEHSSKKQ